MHRMMIITVKIIGYLRTNFEINKACYHWIGVAPVGVKTEPPIISEHSIIINHSQRRVLSYVGRPVH